MYYTVLYGPFSRKVRVEKGRDMCLARVKGRKTVVLYALTVPEWLPSDQYATKRETEESWLHNLQAFIETAPRGYRQRLLNGIAKDRKVTRDMS